MATAHLFTGTAALARIGLKDMQERITDPMACCRTAGKDFGGRRFGRLSAEVVMPSG